METFAAWVDQAAINAASEHGVAVSRPRASRTASRSFATHLLKILAKAAEAAGVTTRPLASGDVMTRPGSHA